MPEKRWRSPGGVWEKLKPQARTMRKKPTTAEAILWKGLRGRALKGTKFRRQHAIGGFIVDFFCSAAALVVEVDGAIHQKMAAADRERQAFLENQGFTVLRFSNASVEGNLESVLTEIAAHLPG